MIREMNDQGVQSADLRQVCAEMERRLSAGENCTAESLLASHSQLASDTDAALEVIYTEFVAREQLGQRPVPAEFCERFPQFRDGLEQLFQIHDAAGGANAVMSLCESAIPAVDNGCTQAIGETIHDRLLRRFGNYEILAEIGRGGMGVVYKARQTGLNRMVALKMILTGDDAGPGERARFRAEAEAAARLQHPNIVQIHEIGEHEGRPFLALELIEGGSLDQLLKGSPLSAASAARLVETLARAIHHAHEKGVVHRDLKPANILLTELGSWRHPHGEVRVTGVVKITDFGLASRMPRASLDQTPRPELTAPNAIIGTPAYMAPEQAGVKGQSIGPAADVYALGAILYELLTGRPPFQGVDVLETLEQVRNSDPVPPGRLMPRMPRDIETICLKCLCKLPTQRYASAADLADDIGRFLRGEPILARSTPAWEKAWKRAKRRPVAAGLLLGLVATLGTGTVSVTVLWRKSTAALHRVQEAQDETKTELAAKLVALARRDWMANDIDAARHHLGECPPDRRGPDWRYLNRVCNATIAMLRSPGPQQQRSTSLAWSPEGGSLAANFSEQVALCWDASSWQQRFKMMIQPSGYARIGFDSAGQFVSLDIPPLQPAKPREPRTLTVRVWKPENQWMIRELKVELGMPAPVLSGDGRTIAVWRPDGIDVIDVGSGTKLSNIPIRNAAGPGLMALSQDGRLLAIALNLKLLRVWDVANGNVIWKLSSSSVDHLAFSPDGRTIAICASDKVMFSGRIEVWDYRTGKRVHVLHGHSPSAACSAFSSDGRRLATGGSDTTVMIWDLETGKEQFSFRGHTGLVLGVAFSPDNTRLASCSYDGTVRIWDVRPLE